MAAKKTKVMVTMSPVVLEKLDNFAFQVHLSRSECVEQLLKLCIKAHDDRKLMYNEFDGFYIVG